MKFGMNEIISLLVVLGIGVIVGALIVRYYWKRERREWEKWQEEKLGSLRQYQKRENVLVLDYNERVNFITLDGGKNWYQYEATDEEGVKIVIDGKISQPALTRAIRDQLAIEQAVANGLLF